MALVQGLSSLVVVIIAGLAAMSYRKRTNGRRGFGAILVMGFAVLAIVSVQVASYAVKHAEHPSISDPVHTFGSAVCKSNETQGRRSCHAYRNPIHDARGFSYEFGINGVRYTGQDSFGFWGWLVPSAVEHPDHVPIVYSRSDPTRSYAVITTSDRDTVGITAISVLMIVAAAGWLVRVNRRARGIESGALLATEEVSRSPVPPKSRRRSTYGASRPVRTRPGRHVARSSIDWMNCDRVTLRVTLPEGVTTTITENLPDTRFPTGRRVYLRWVSRRLWDILPESELPPGAVLPPPLTEAASS